MKFSELAIGTQFKVNDIAYTKVEPQKVSCCRTLNAVNLLTNEKVMIKPNDVVEVVSSEAK